LFRFFFERKTWFISIAFDINPACHAFGRKSAGRFSPYFIGLEKLGTKKRLHI
jgi:hypothetical protein